jgi:Ca2+-binding RTX toxin-like protein
MATYVGNDLRNVFTGTNETMYGLGGDDDLRANGGVFTTIYGGEGNDLLVFEAESATGGELYGGRGNDSLYADSIFLIGDILSGDAGNDYLAGYGGDDILDGGTGNDLLFGGLGADLLEGGSGTDGLVGGSGNDRLYGGDGDDTTVAIEVGHNFFDTTGGLFGEAGNDYIDGGIGNDHLDGGADSDILLGGEGNDTLVGGLGADKMSGGGGNDYFRVDDAADRIIEGEGDGTDTVATSVSYQLRAGVAVEKLAASSGSSTTSLNFVGNEYDQRILGNDGVNKIYGREGNDILTGNGGNDFFIFDTKPNASSNADTITDFSNVSGNNDTIRLENAVFTALTTTGALGSGFFAANSSGTAQDSSDRICYETDTGNLYYDSNGSGAGGSVLFANLTNIPSLTSSDFFIV